VGGNAIERVIRGSRSLTGLILLWAIAKLRWQIKVIMVDESQDTDQVQIELIASLIELGQSFIIAVGDHYQSVY
jgi:ATP-dependent exoDNAse (exonuclease V) beta subunit